MITGNKYFRNTKCVQSQLSASYTLFIQKENWRYHSPFNGFLEQFHTLVYYEFSNWFWAALFSVVRHLPELAVKLAPKYLGNSSLAKQTVWEQSRNCTIQTGEAKFQQDLKIS